jgi:hypothetical protein
MTVLTLPLSVVVTTPAPSAPPRVNLAGFCDFCGLLGCQSPQCVAAYQDTWWAVCDRCGGTCVDPLRWTCYCFSGVIPVEPDYPGAVRAR